MKERFLRQKAVAGGLRAGRTDKCERAGNRGFRGDVTFCIMVSLPVYLFMRETRFSFSL